MAKNNKKGVSKGTAAMMGLGAAAVAAAGAYWFYGAKDAAQHRKSARSWMLKARAEVLEGVERVVDKAGEIDKEAYMAIVSGVLARYGKLAGVTTAGLAQMKRDMVDAWAHMQKTHKGTAKKKTKKATKKAAKKS